MVADAALAQAHFVVPSPHERQASHQGRRGDEEPVRVRRHISRASNYASRFKLDGINMSTCEGLDLRLTEWIRAHAGAPCPSASFT